MILVPVARRRTNAAGATGASATGDTTDAGRCWSWMTASAKDKSKPEYAGCEQWSAKLSKSPLKFVWREMHTFSPAIASSICQIWLTKGLCDQLAKGAAKPSQAVLGTIAEGWDRVADMVGGALGIDGDCTGGRNTQSLHADLFGAWKFAAVDALGVTGSPPVTIDGVSYATSANQYASDEAGQIYPLLRNCGGGNETAMLAALKARAATYPKVAQLIHAASVARVTEQMAAEGEDWDTPGGAKILLRNMQAAKLESAKLEGHFAANGVSSGPAYVIPKEVEAEAAGAGLGTAGAVVGAGVALGVAGAAWYWRRPILAALRKVWRKVA